MSKAEPLTTEDAGPPATLGARLRQARLQEKLTVREVARQLGVSASFVSQLENNKSQPSVATLFSIARLLGVSVDTLFEKQDATAPPAEPPDGQERQEEEPESPADSSDPAPISRKIQGFSSVSLGDQPSDARHSITTPGHRSRLMLESGVVWEQLVRKSDDLDFIEIIYPPGSSSTTDGRMLRHDDYEYGILLEGELEVTIGFDVYTLNAGEAIGFDSRIPHLLSNPGTTPARGIWVMHHIRE